ncbi:ImmA/IrrE family metallo-endopeptidase [Sinorhizobium psoraleae]|uniref:ImmA/IrrE family metallo-endopeptidase n=1 Tax=Sinorhizobium psoraleae TaxID=520838 RepID=A0ABT4KI97_9HYPH|nr:ImmA/IrrE family metallo-endopeptidase [Sinorhizobium psoraleae]MCZ4091699.1 ImmA/IrrE family metallo-endopeptidase [Sinorhizobium psoraleae]
MRRPRRYSRWRTSWPTYGWGERHFQCDAGRSDLGTHKRVEKKCNQIAAEFLVPTARFRARWVKEDTLERNADRLAKLFKVSRIVIARRAFDLGLVNGSAYRRFYAIESAMWAPRHPRVRAGAISTTPFRCEMASISLTRS